MTFEVTDTGAGSKGHNNHENFNCRINDVDENVILNTLVNSTEVTPHSGVYDRQLHELSDLSGVKNKEIYTNVNHNDGTHTESDIDRYRTSDVDMHDTCSQTVHTLNNVVNSRTAQLKDRNNHSITTNVGTNTVKFQNSQSVKPGSVQPFIYYPVSLFYIISHDLTRNAGIWYCYIHGYPSGSTGGFYLIDISHTDGQIHVFQCVVQHIAPLYVEGTLFLGIQPVLVVNQYLHQDLLDARRTFDNYKHDQFTQYTFGVK